MLSLIIIIPLIGLIINNIRSLKKKEVISISGINLIISIIIWLRFDYNTSNFQQIEEYRGYMIGIDGISIIFIIMTTFLTIPIILMVSDKSGDKSKITINRILLLSSLLIGVFTILDIFIWYICFEIILIPMFILMITYSSSSKYKIFAAYQLFLYTLMGSLFMLIGILIIYYQLGSTNYIYLYQILYSNNENKSMNILLFLLFFISFAIKIPIFPFHIWLPYAHTEAPTSGSIILASIILKLGLYGLIRFIIPLLKYGLIIFKPIIMTLIIISIIYPSFVILNQINLKKIIAYSSIVHMNASILGLISSSREGISGTLFIMISHGIISSGLFYGCHILYSRTNSYIIKYYRGLMYSMPIYSLLLFILLISNAAVPGTIGFIGELICFNKIYKDYNITTIGITLISVVGSAIYNFWLINRIIFGNPIIEGNSKTIRVNSSLEESNVDLKGSGARLSGNLNKEVGITTLLYQRYNRIDLSYREFIIILPLGLIVIIGGIIPNVILSVFNSSIFAL